jgi:membrane protein implicated in regulation of membrane protease activity
LLAWLLAVLACTTALAQEQQVRLALLGLAVLLAAFRLAAHLFQPQEAGHLLLCLGLLVLVVLLPLCRQQKIPQIYSVRHSHLWQKLFKLVEILEQSRLQ